MSALSPNLRWLDRDDAPKYLSCMLKKPPERYWTREAIDLVADHLSLQNAPWMQDWAYQVAEAGNLDQYLSFFEKMHGHDDVRFVLADIIVQAFEEVGNSLHRDARWTVFKEELLKNVELHAHQIWYWSSFDTSLEEAWRVSSDMRLLAERA